MRRSAGLDASGRAGPGGRHRRVLRDRRHPPTLRPATAFPGLLGPGRRAAWRRFVVRRVAAVTLVIAGYALALAGEPGSLVSLVSR